MTISAEEKLIVFFLILLTNYFRYSYTHTGCPEILLFRRKDQFSLQNIRLENPW